MKKHHWVVVFDKQKGWHIEPEVEEEVFDNGTIYDTDTYSWSSGYKGDGVYDETDMELTHVLLSILETMNEVK
jgi:hypothetical protein